MPRQFNKVFLERDQLAAEVVEKTNQIEQLSLRLAESDRAEIRRAAMIARGRAVEKASDKMREELAVAREALEKIRNAKMNSLYAFREVENVAKLALDRMIVIREKPV